MSDFHRPGRRQGGVRTDSTIAPPPKTAISLTNVSWLLDTSKDARKKTSPCISLFAKDDRTMASGWQGASYFRRYGRELVSKPAISLKKNWGGAIVQRLVIQWLTNKMQIKFNPRKKPKLDLASKFLVNLGPLNIGNSLLYLFGRSKPVKFTKNWTEPTGKKTDKTGKPEQRAEPDKCNRHQYF